MSLAARDQLSLIRIETQIALVHLRNRRDQFSSNEEEATSIQHHLEGVLLEEINKLSAIGALSHDDLVLARIESRNKEIEKEITEIKIEWLEKLMYDLHIENSPEKIKLLNQIIRLKKSDLLSHITHCVAAFREEKLLLSRNLPIPEDLQRVTYVDEHIKILEKTFGEIQNLSELYFE